MAAVTAGTALAANAPAPVAAVVAAESRTCFGPQPYFAGDPGDVALVNLTPLNARGVGHGALVGSNVADPGVSTVNWTPDEINPNVGAAPFGDDGLVCFVNSGLARVDVLADVLGVIHADAFTAAGEHGTPVRALDTRAGDPVPAGGQRCFTIPGAVAGDAAFVNLTPVDADGVGYATLVPAGVDTAGGVSNVNFAPDGVDPNLAVTVVGDGGQVCFVNSELAGVHVIADVAGSVHADTFTAPSATGGPVRVVDTRVDGIAVEPAGQRCFQVPGGAAGDLALVNVTPVNATAAGYGKLVTVDDGIEHGGGSNVNFAPGSVDPNFAATVVGDDGQVCFVNSEHATVDVIVDMLGVVHGDAVTVYTPDGGPLRRVDTISELAAKIPFSSRPVDIAGGDPVGYGQLTVACETVNEVRPSPWGDYRTTFVGTVRGLDPGEPIAVRVNASRPGGPFLYELEAAADGLARFEFEQTTTIVEGETFLYRLLFSLLVTITSGEGDTWVGVDVGVNCELPVSRDW